MFSVLNSIVALALTNGLYLVPQVSGSWAYYYVSGW